MKVTVEGKGGKFEAEFADARVLELLGKPMTIAERACSRQQLESEIADLKVEVENQRLLIERGVLSAEAVREAAVPELERLRREKKAALDEADGRLKRQGELTEELNGLRAGMSALRDVLNAYGLLARGMEPHQVARVLDNREREHITLKALASECEQRQADQRRLRTQLDEASVKLQDLHAVMAVLDSAHVPRIDATGGKDAVELRQVERVARLRDDLHRCREALKNATAQRDYARANAGGVVRGEPASFPTCTACDGTGRDPKDDLICGACDGHGDMRSRLPAEPTVTELFERMAPGATVKLTVSDVDRGALLGVEHESFTRRAVIDPTSGHIGRLGAFALEQLRAIDGLRKDTDR